MLYYSNYCLSIIHNNSLLLKFFFFNIMRYLTLSSMGIALKSINTIHAIRVRFYSSRYNSVAQARLTNGRDENNNNNNKSIL